MGLTVQRRQARLRAPLLLWGRPDRLHTARALASALGASGYP